MLLLVASGLVNQEQEVIQKRSQDSTGQWAAQIDPEIRKPLTISLKIFYLRKNYFAFFEIKFRD